jgi:hypothetical protein
MELDIILNELSLHAPVQDIRTAREMMSSFIQTVIAARKKGITAFRAHADLNNELLAPDYPVNRWRNDREVNPDERRYFGRLQTKYPYLVGYKELADKNQLYSFTYEESRADGLGAAYHLEALSISFRSHERWHVSRINLVAEWMDEEDEGIRTENISINHVSCTDHITEHESWITERCRASIRSGTDMWNRRTDLWSSLIFCESVGSQLQSLGERDPMLPQVWRRLNCLQEYCQRWESGAFNKDELQCTASLESESTMQQAQYVRARTFHCPDGEDRVFEWHVKISLNAWRIYFYPLPSTKQIIVGYIGVHPKNTTNPT